MKVYKSKTRAHVVEYTLNLHQVECPFCSGHIDEDVHEIEFMEIEDAMNFARCLRESEQFKGEQIEIILTD